MGTVIGECWRAPNQGRDRWDWPNPGEQGAGSVETRPLAQLLMGKGMTTRPEVLTMVPELGAQGWECWGVGVCGVPSPCGTACPPAPG